MPERFEARNELEQKLMLEAGLVQQLRSN